MAGKAEEAEGKLMGLEEQELKKLQDLEEQYKRCAAVNNYLLNINFALGKLLIAKGVVTKEMETAILAAHERLSAHVATEITVRRLSEETKRPSAEMEGEIRGEAD